MKIFIEIHAVHLRQNLGIKLRKNYASDDLELEISGLIISLQRL